MDLPVLGRGPHVDQLDRTSPPPHGSRAPRRDRRDAHLILQTISERDTTGVPHRGWNQGEAVIPCSRSDFSTHRPDFPTPVAVLQYSWFLTQLYSRLVIQSSRDRTNSRMRRGAPRPKCPAPQDVSRGGVSGPAERGLAGLLQAGRPVGGAAVQVGLRDDRRGGQADVTGRRSCSTGGASGRRTASTPAGDRGVLCFLGLRSSSLPGRPGGSRCQGCQGTMHLAAHVVVLVIRQRFQGLQGHLGGLDKTLASFVAAMIRTPGSSSLSVSTMLESRVGIASSLKTAANRKAASLLCRPWIY